MDALSQPPPAPPASFRHLSRAPSLLLAPIRPYSLPPSTSPATSPPAQSSVTARAPPLLVNNTATARPAHPAPLIATFARHNVPHRPTVLFHDAFSPATRRHGRGTTKGDRRHQRKRHRRLLKVVLSLLSRHQEGAGQAQRDLQSRRARPRVRRGRHAGRAGGHDPSAHRPQRLHQQEVHRR